MFARQHRANGRVTGRARPPLRLDFFEIEFDCRARTGCQARSCQHLVAYFKPAAMAGLEELLTFGRRWSGKHQKPCQHDRR